MGSIIEKQIQNSQSITFIHKKGVIARTFGNC